MSTLAFADVDETLISVKSMFRFLRFHLRERGEPDGTYDRLVGELRTAARRGAPRSEINRGYYRLYAGEEVLTLTAAGLRWFAYEQEEQQRQGSGLFIPEVERALAGHRATGDELVLVSGSFFACLDPVATHVGATAAFGTRPLQRRGRLTGEVLFPMIGPAKGRVARVTAALRGADPAHCTAYGDHITDLALLEAVGRPVAVGQDPELVAHADRAGWQRLATQQTATAI
ncbi:HAD-IB family hydrolase [Streptomyces sp. NPDC002082]|uniref:HAD family hydrolase n=1 Tax=Streptomyces sp. NPDC002082 TaxID=3154772 RepID=UPI00332FB12B